MSGEDTEVYVDDPSGLASIVRGLRGLAELVKAVLPIHPRTRNRVEELGLGKELYSNPNITVTKPLGYVDFLKLVMDSKLVVTDSGGVQREAYLLGKPAMVLAIEQSGQSYCRLSGSGLWAWTPISW